MKMGNVEDASKKESEASLAEIWLRGVGGWVGIGGGSRRRLERAWGIRGYDMIEAKAQER